MDNEEEGALLGVKDYEHDLKEKICLVQTQNPGTAQNDKLSHDLEQNQPVKKWEFNDTLNINCIFNTLNMLTLSALVVKSDLKSVLFQAISNSLK